MTIATALRQGEQLLAEGGVAAPRLTAEVLLAHAMGCGRAYFYGHPEQELTQIQWLHFGRYLHERLRGKPSQYITCRQEFYGRPFRVTQAVMIPRPETEHLVETAIRLGRRAATVVDAGCGSGAIAVTLQLELRTRVLATDISAEALAVASENARRLAAAIDFLRCDLVSAVADASVDLLVSNPPYVPLTEKDALQREVRDWEPPVALFGGPEGLDFYRRLAAEGARILRPGGWLMVEMGIRQLQPIREMLGTDWTEVRVSDDLAGLPRVLAARLPGR
ncbi:MAG: peptide chain release factor N(5)-glutamine methyltransferase [Bryobacteraceae bacterium]|nr:peptide chain release factor N(5)-glutamine methyltransferase [Bryobacteraceae bacterium]